MEPAGERKVVGTYQANRGGSESESRNHNQSNQHFRQNEFAQSHTTHLTHTDSPRQASGSEKEVHDSQHISENSPDLVEAKSVLANSHDQQDQEGLHPRATGAWGSGAREVDHSRDPSAHCRVEGRERHSSHQEVPDRSSRLGDPPQQGVPQEVRATEVQSRRASAGLGFQCHGGSAAEASHGEDLCPQHRGWNGSGGIRGAQCPVLSRADGTTALLCKVGDQDQRGGTVQQSSSTPGQLVETQKDKPVPTPVPVALSYKGCRKMGTASEASSSSTAALMGVMQQLVTQVQEMKEDIDDMKGHPHKKSVKDEDMESQWSPVTEAKGS